MKAYAKAKARIYGKNAIMVINRDDDVVAAMVPPPEVIKSTVRGRPAKQIHRNVVRFGLDAPKKPGDFGLVNESGMAWLVRAMELDPTIKLKKGEEAEIIASQGIDLIITGSDWFADVRRGAPNTFITAALFAGRFITKDEILRGAIEVSMQGADSVLTPRSMEVVEMLAKEGLCVQGHVGMVPSTASRHGGMRTLGKTAAEALNVTKTQADQQGGVLCCLD